MSEYTEINEEIIQKLIDICGDSSVLTDIMDIFPYSMDGTLFTGETIPEVVVQPQNKEQISEILVLANENKVPVTPRGSGTSLAGNPLPIYGGIILDLTSLDIIEEISIADNIVIVEPGVICDNLNAKLAPLGYFFPPDPASSSAATIGGMIANNSGGLQAFKYGVTANYVLWLEVVLPSGKIVEFGSKTLKSVSSLNLGGLMIGSEGVLGIVTKIALKIKPLPESRRTGFYIFKDFETITEVIIAIRNTRIVPNMQEFLDKMTTKVCFQYLGGDYTNYPLGYFLLLEVDGAPEQVEKDYGGIHQICTSLKPIFHKIAESPEDRDNIIQARKVALPALSQLAPTTSLEDCTINISHLAEALHKIEEIAKEFVEKGLKVATFGHLEGNLHPTFMFNEHNDEDVKNFNEAVDKIYNDVVIPLGGTITGEHGVGLVKARFIEKEHPSALKLMHKVKRLFDPNLILNPGKAKGSLVSEYKNPIELTQKSLVGVPSPSCMRCGFCVNECPSYSEFRRESYSPRGKLSLIRGILRGNIPVNEKFTKILFACTLCGACETACPALIKTVDLFEGVRSLINSGDKE
ncbi:MAG: FAD-binding protein [Candidatus Lokiarchaeota archaeon]|nr:FAD-binding protein [Candidatus Lokiarchaeota archaeon]